MRIMLTALCVVLAGAFAAASATSVVDHLQHDTPILHTHDGRLALAMAGDHHADQAHDDDADQGAVDHPPGLGHHHHADAPIGALGVASVLEHGLFAIDPSRPRFDDLDVRGVRPGGLDRPPEAFATLV